ncbi:MAG: acetyl-CoA carboxylase biotin carboxylase subunit family protein [Spirochaetaceae bacterium]
MRKNIFVLGLEEYNLHILRSLPGADRWEIHSLLGYGEMRGEDAANVEELVNRCTGRLDSFSGSIDAIIGYFDFPVTVMIPLLRSRYGLPTPTLESVLKCEHKYWSRLEQARVIPEHIPRFYPFDPFDDAQIESLALLFPYWIKPIKSFRSYLAFQINDGNDLQHAIEETRAHIRTISDSFSYFIDQAELPREIAEMEGRSCIAESLLSGSQCTIEGYMYEGELHVYGVVDSVREGDRSSFSRYEYPSQMPEEVQKKMEEIAGKVLRRINFDNSPFNIEFFYNQTDGQVYLLEINPRISQSHGEMFEKVNGLSHHEVALDIAMGRRPEYPLGGGVFKVSAKFMLRHFEDAVLTKVPTQEEIRRAEEEIPGAHIDVLVEAGVRLSDLKNQDSYSYELADIYIGAQERGDLVERYNRVLEIISFEFEPGEESYSV